MDVRTCIIIPVYNHARALAIMLENLAPCGLDCILVDDGSTDEFAAISNGLSNSYSNLSIHRMEKNLGKGSAISIGFELAYSKGYTHALTFDADGQHNHEQIAEFLSHCRQHPNSLILGAPVFDKSAPKIRVLGRELSNVLTWMETLSFRARDVLCGFRIYPLHNSMPVIRKVRTKRMEFDTEIVVRLCWAGIDVINVPTAVKYPIDGISHFHYLNDNLKIIVFHLMLIPEMIFKLPYIIKNKFKRKTL